MDQNSMPRLSINHDNCSHRRPSFLRHLYANQPQRRHRCRHGHLLPSGRLNPNTWRHSRIQKIQKPKQNQEKVAPPRASFNNQIISSCLARLSTSDYSRIESSRWASSLFERGYLSPNYRRIKLFRWIFYNFRMHSILNS